MTSLLFNILNLDSWVLRNIDTNETITGQFYAEELTENISAKYETQTSLSREKPNVQYIHMNPYTISFKARMYQESFVPDIQQSISPKPGLDFISLKQRLNKLKEWARPMEDKGRPPILEFISNNGDVMIAECVITGLGGITYAKPTLIGRTRDVSLSINLLEWHKISIEESKTFKTRYHNVAEGDYYEMLTYREYDDPRLGDVIRKDHPTQPVLQIADTVELPSEPGMRGATVTQTSVAFKTAWGKTDTPQRQLRKQILETRNRTYISHILDED